MRWIFILIGVLIIVASAIWLFTVQRFISRSTTANGEVVELTSGGSHPKVTFNTQKGEKISYPQNGLIFGYKVGDKVSVLYDSEDTKNASVNSFGALWGFPTLGVVMGIFFIIVALISEN